MPLQLILVAGPYRSGTGDDPALIAKNVDAMTDASLVLFRAGHLPVMGEWFALPLIERAGSKRIGDAAFDEIFHPVARRLVAKCDGCLRIGVPNHFYQEWLEKTFGADIHRAAADLLGEGVRVSFQVSCA